MKAKTINAVISKKFDQWKKSIDDEALQNLIEQNTICTGGCIASMLLNEDVNDFDFYFRNRDTALAVAHYYVEKFKSAKPADRSHISVKELPDRITIMVKSAGVAGENDTHGYDSAAEFSKEEQKEIAAILEDAEDAAAADVKEKAKDKYRPVFLSRNAISLSSDIQLVIRFYGEPDQIHDTYDFIHACNYWTSWGRAVVLRPAALEALLARELRYHGSKYPLCSLFRLKKFVERGWHVNCGTILRIVWNLRDYDLTDLAVLEEQLTGVDISYFMQVIEALRDKNKQTGVVDDRVDGTYLMELINRIF